MKDDVLLPYTGADALNDALMLAGVDCVFLNSGTDYPPIIESWAKYEAGGKKTPRIIISPHEYAGMSAAQGYAQITGKAQAMFVHVDVGTQNLGGAIHNAYRCRTPVFVLAGLSPYTMEGELPGGRNAHIQFLQNVADQGSIVREYTKLNYEYRTAKNIQQMTHRALQIAHSEPMGPVYMMATREVLEEDSMDVSTDLRLWKPVSPAGLDDESVSVLTRALADAKKPLIITSYSGRNTECPPALVKLAETLAIPVIEADPPVNMNFPGDHPMHAGFQARGFIEHADVVLVIDCDMPWMPVLTGPKAKCRVFYIDIDPIKEDIPLWYIKSERFMRADSYTALGQINNWFMQNPWILNQKLIESRRAKVVEIHKKMRDSWAYKEGGDERTTPEFLTECLRDIIDDDTVILNEAITNGPLISQMLPRNKPGTLFSSGGSSLGWNGGAAVGMKLACPKKDIMALTGDGSYIFSCPTAVHWMAGRYNAPFLTVIYNNQGWNAPKMITRGQHPDGYAAKADNYWTSLAPGAQLDKIAEAAGGAFARTVAAPGELRQALAEARDAVRGGRCAVVNVLLPPV
ncbi:MAG: thiamine pyrophosphate-requiring protein [Oscillospiraceae bacterium]|nr:thiamine pyrophosphate-requiring protein [Oscillospiraceae bacterium]